MNTEHYNVEAKEREFFTNMYTIKIIESFQERREI